MLWPMMMLTTKQLNLLMAACLLLAPAPARGYWPEFRGPSGMGLASAPGDTKPLGLPLHWSETENVTWKTAIPHRGWSTPVVMDGRIWLTTATLDGHDFFVICVDADSGRILLNKKLFHADNPEPLGNRVNCYASPSPAIEPGRVYIHFGSYGTACMDTATHEVLWRRTDLPCRHYRGPGSSVILYQGLLILTMDGVDLQYLVALDKKTGRTVWKTDRSVDFDDLGSDGKPTREGDFRKAFSTPLIIDVNGTKQMISAGAKAVYGYDPAGGREIWRLSHRDHSSSARPVFGRGLAYVMTGLSRTELLAIRLGPRGELNDSHIAWRTKHSVPRMPSPLLVDDLLFTINDSGVATCMDAATGSQFWKENIRGDYIASPIYADGRIYCFSNDGRTTVLAAARNYNLLATNKLASGFMASPATSKNALILRTKTHLYKIQTP